MKSVLVTSFLISLQIVVSATVSQNEIKMIVDIVTSYKIPTVVAAKVCWRSADKIHLATLFSKNDESKSIKFINQNLEANNMIPRQSFIVIADIKCPNISNFLNEVSEKGLFGKPYRWLFFGKSSNEHNEVLKELKNLNVFPDSEVIVTKNDNNTFTYLKLIYKLRIIHEWFEEDFGTWTKDKGLVKSESMLVSTAMRRKNIHKQPIITSSIISDDYNTRYKLNDLSPSEIFTDPMTKAGYRHTEPLYEFVNATNEIIFTDSWGKLLNNGSWTGMVGQLHRGEAELCGLGAFLAENRMEFIEFIIRPVNLRAAFVFRKPRLSYQNNLFLLPFKTSVWICIAGFIVLLSIILYVNAQWEMKKSNLYSIKETNRTSINPNVSDIATLVVAAVTQQGSTTEFKGTLGRIVMFLLFLAFLFLYTSYSASIVALLQSSSSQIRTLNDLLHSRLELGVEEAPYTRDLFPSMTEPIRKAIYEKKIIQGNRKNFFTLEDGLKKLLKEPFAFHINLGTGYRFLQKISLEHEKCGLTEIEYFQFNTPWLCCKKQSPYTEIFKIGYYRIQEHGLFDRTNRLIFGSKPQCLSRNSNFISVNMIDMYPALLFLVYGMIVAVLFLFFEIMWRRIHLQRKSKVRQCD